MLWRLPGHIRTVSFTAHRRFNSTTVSARTSEPLRILFCGSDDFSVASLRALVEAKRDTPELIQSIDVLHRPAKPTGRGLKTLREVPIQQVATDELNLRTHAVDTFTGWAAPSPVDLIIAVSFGLFVPPRILSYSRYGGLNVHPSLLPDLRGPAPIEHAILKGREYTGVSVQTLHPKHFDQGTILAQTPARGIPIAHGTTATELEQTLAITGARMLIDVLKSRSFIPPLENVGWYNDSNGLVDHAPRITKQDRFVDFSKHTLANVFAKQRALGDPWCILPNGDRLILLEMTDSGMIDHNRSSGLFLEPLVKEPMFRAACGGIGILAKSTYEGKKHGSGNMRLKQVL